MIIGVTGGIGAGKSYVCARLHARYGFPVYDCDRHAKELMTESTTLRRQLEALVGQRLFDERGIIRERLSAFLFASDEHARQVAAIVHPVVRDDFLRWADEQRGRHVLLESAILYESGFHTLADVVLFIDAPLEVRVRRAMERDRASREQVEVRIARQGGEDMRHRADYCVTNDGEADLDETLARLPFVGGGC